MFTVTPHRFQSGAENADKMPFTGPALPLRGPPFWPGSYFMNVPVQNRYKDTAELEPLSDM